MKERKNGVLASASIIQDVMSNTERSNFEFIQSIIDQEQDEGLQDLLGTIKKQTMDAERQVAMNHDDQDYSQCIRDADTACDSITYLFMQKMLPEDWDRLTRNKKGELKKSSPGKHDIWITEHYSEKWETDQSDLSLFIELFDLKGEANHAKHGKKNEYDRPKLITDENGKLLLVRKANGDLEMDEEKGIADPAVYSTLQNSLRRLRNMFDFLCAVLVKCEYITKKDVPVYREPKRLITITEGAATKIIENVQRFEDYTGGQALDPNESGHSLSTNRKTIIAIAVVAIVALIGIAIFLINTTDGNGSSESALALEQDIDSHIIMKLSNANHQYEVGLENWKRLDYNRAERDIAGAIKDISEEKSQAETDVARINNSLGCLYLDMGRYEESYDYLNNAYVTFKDEYGENSSETLAVLFSIAQYDYYTGDYDSALKTAQQILDNADIANNSTIATLIKNFQASIYLNRGNYEKALEIYKEVLDIYKDYIKDDTLINELASYTEDSALDENEREKYTNMVLAIAKTYENIGKTYTMLGRNDEALKAIKTGLNMCLDNIYIGKKNISTANLYLQKATTESQTGSIDAAIEDADLAIRIERNLFDFEDVYPGLVEAYDLYGVLMEEQGKNEEASDYYNSALDLALKSFGENHPNTAEAYYYCGLYAYNEKRYEEAEKNLLKAVDIRKNILGENHPNTMKYYLLLSSVESALGNETTANEYKDDAEKIKQNLNLSNAAMVMFSVDSDFLQEEFPEYLN